MKRAITVTAIAIGFVLTALPEDPPKPPAFVLTELEQVKKDNLQLRKKLLEEQYQDVLRSIQKDAAEYAAKTLAAHGNPEGVMFNQDVLDWIIIPPPPAKSAEENKEPKAEDKKQ